MSLYPLSKQVENWLNIWVSKDLTLGKVNRIYMGVNYVSLIKEMFSLMHRCQQKFISDSNFSDLGFISIRASVKDLKGKIF